MTIKTKKSKNLIKLLLLAGVLVVGGIFLNNKKPFDSRGILTTKTSPSPTSNSTNKFDPKLNSEQAQRQSTSPTPTTTNSTQSVKTLKPIITGVDGDSDASNSRVSVDALSDGATSGTCTLTLTQGNNVVTTTSSVVQIATYYGCATLHLDKSKLTAGAAVIKVNVNSNGGSGTSDDKTITVVK